MPSSLQRSLQLCALFVLGLFAVSSVWATSIPIRGASGYGASSGFTNCLNGTFAADSFGDACEAFNLTSVGTATFDGTITLDVFQFGFNSGSGTNPQSFYIVDLGSLSSGSTFTLSSSLFNPANAEVFSCGQNFDPLSNPQSAATDSGSSTMTGPCTPNLTTAPLTFSNGLFTDSVSGDLVLDFPVVTSTPEPASLALLGLGLLAVSGKLRRKSA